MTTEPVDWMGVGASSARFRTLDHTADVGIEVRATTLDELLAGALEGMTALILGEARPAPVRIRTVVSEGEDPADLLRNLLREVLYLHEAEGFAVAEAEVAVERGAAGGAFGGPGTAEGPVATEGGRGPDADPEEAASSRSGLSVRARLSGGPDPAPPDRELKGVTLHGLRADPVGDGWVARVIFDV